MGVMKSVEFLFLIGTSQQPVALDVIKVCHKQIRDTFSIKIHALLYIFAQNHNKSRKLDKDRCQKPPNSSDLRIG